jgi:hypothetical protein
MKKVLFLLVIYLLGCTKEVNKTSPPTITPISNDRLVFQDFDELYKTYLTLARNYSGDGLIYWAQCKNHSTLLDSPDTTLNIYSAVFRTILNKDSEFELGNEIIWFNMGNFYTLPESQENIDSFKCNPDTIRKIGLVKINYLVERNDKGVIIWNNDPPDARNQHEFWQTYKTPCGQSRTYVAGNRKYVHEVYGESLIGYNGWCGCYHIYSSLWLRIKLEWKGSGSWKVASEQRNIKLTDLHGTAWWGWPKTYVADLDIDDEVDSCFSNNGSLGGEKLVWLTGLDGELYEGQSDNWDLTLYGTIYQHVIGDFQSHAWWNGPSLWE